ncbi:uncharacterized protein LOC132564562 [Ylistrum balloti]|uniref:uncharacterized protein LOC132564562 n=1 Tax=Ylistrum balloti TaxID=509963 RepID=UPI002905B3B9|nr:uncharacterized protein LOC132564562 [Ylistrum balloti]
MYNQSNTNSTTTLEPNSIPLVHYIMLWTLCSVAIIAFAEHFAIILFAYVNKTLRQKSYIIAVLFLSSSDILLAMALFHFSLIRLLQLKQIWICGLAYFLIQLGFVTSLVHTLIICTERYMCMRPIPTKVMSLRKRQSLTLVSIFICSLILGTPYLFSRRQSTIKICLLTSIFGNNLSYALIPVRSIIFFLWICTIIVYVITANNFCKNVRRAGSSYGQVYVTDSDQSDSNLAPKGMDNVREGESLTRSLPVLRRKSNQNTAVQAQTEAFRIVSVVFIVFLISMTPQSVVGLVMLFVSMPDTVEFGCAIFAIASIMTNPIMYTCMLKDFRKLIIRR